MSQIKAKLLLLEDDPNLGFVLKEYLEHNGYNVTLQEDGELGLRAFNGGQFDICIVDIMMPKMDGFSFTKQVRKIDKKIPIIFLTAKSMKEDKIEGFKIGGDDYITKPFSMEELELRVEAVLRRSMGDSTSPQTQTEFEIGDYTFKYSDRSLVLNGESNRLTTKEADLLRLLCLNKNEVLEREIALKLVWDNDSYFTGRSMDVFISKLRKHLKQDDKVEIMSVHGRGLKLLVKESV